jgi:hypothetical protein
LLCFGTTVSAGAKKLDATLSREKKSDAQSNGIAQ